MLSAYISLCSCISTGNKAKQLYIIWVQVRLENDGSQKCVLYFFNQLLISNSIVMQLQALGEILAEATMITNIVLGLFVFYNHFHFDSRIKRLCVLLPVSIYIYISVVTLCLAEKLSVHSASRMAL